jgi:ferredoxin-nitrate reductase
MTTMLENAKDRIKNIWGQRTPFHQNTWPERLDQHLTEEPDEWVQSACVLCSNGCGIDIGTKNGKIVGVRGRTVDRVNHGRLGPKGLFGWIANNSKERLTTPLIRKNGNLVPATWDEAMNLIVQNTKSLIEKYTGGCIGFYNSGQLFLEEYYTLALLSDLGVKTTHMDGNTRLCTATASMALMESFGTDGNPGSYTDFDLTDTIFHIGHNISYSQTVLWSRILDRLHSANPPSLIVVDPRRTDTAKEAHLHLAPRLGTNLALMNGLLHLIITKGNIDRAYIDAHTVGFEELQKTVSTYSPTRVSNITNIPVKLIEEAGEILGNTPSLVSTVLQGVYQSNQATASALQVNNLHLIRGLIGKPGSTVFQMNGQPTAQNTRECGANGELAAFYNYANRQHIEHLAKYWNVNTDDIPHHKPPTHAMQIFRYAEEGSIKMLWIIATNPGVSMPELERIRNILHKQELFVIVQDAFMTETAQLADVVLPAAIWAEKMGCFTNADRTVHISHKAVDPPGDAKSDLEIFCDFATRMDFKDKDGQPLIKWNDPRGAFEAFKQITRGRPCDYTGLTYEKLSGGSGIQWPCNEENPNGKERLYTDGHFNTSADYCEIYGHDIKTGAQIEPEQYKNMDPKGKAKIKAAEYTPPEEEPDDEYPFYLTTGRVAHHFHTRTKTGKSKELNGAAPECFVQIAEEDAAVLGISQDDLLEVTSRRGNARGKARIGDILPGHIFMPFHYGDYQEEKIKHAANELTITGWDPVSKQPYFKYAAVRINKISG